LRKSDAAGSGNSQSYLPPRSGGHKPLLGLTTCGGSFNHATRHYRDNLIVYAARGRLLTSRPEHRPAAR
jgi:hypothetical protein